MGNYTQASVFRGPEKPQPLRGLGFRVSGFRVSGFGFRVSGLGFRV